MKTVIIFIALLVFSCMIQHGVEAAITGWTNPPSANGAATPSIGEDLTAGASTTVTIAATSDGGAITYAIGSQPTTDKLTIAASGLLTLAAGNNFDFETEPTYVLTIVATDAGSATGTATVTLSITDVNDVSPVFAPDQYAATVPDASPEGATVTTVTATDVDTVGTIAYSITVGNDDDHFTIDTDTGAITVKTGATIAASTLAGYSLTVTASDGTTTDDTATVWIAVLTCSSGSVLVVASLITLLAALLTTML